MANYSKRDARAEATKAAGAEIPENRREKQRTRAKWTPLTIGSAMERPPRWIWLHCPGCGNRRPVTLVQFAIRWHPDVPLSQAMKFVRCATCRRPDPIMEIPSTTWSPAGIVTEDFPAELATRGLEAALAPLPRRARSPAPMGGLNQH